MLSAQNVALQIDGKSILNQISLDVEASRVLAVVGPNGAGKSSICRILSGETEPTSGTVSLNDRSLKDYSRKEQAKLRAVLPQQSSLEFNFKVLDVVLMGRSPHSSAVFTKDDIDLAGQALRMADVEHLAQRFYPGLSGGERQRVHLARVLAQIWNSDLETTRYLLLDEPTAALDLSHQHSTLSIAQKLSREQGIGVMIVLHDLNLAALYADVIVVLQDGSIRASGSPSEVLRADLLEEVFNISVTIQKHPVYRDCPLVIASN
ncbi:MAG: heme ABC transporter ATP-binding protein [Pseudomonadota bacterium]